MEFKTPTVYRKLLVTEIMTSFQKNNFVGFEITALDFSFVMGSLSCQVCN